MEKDAPDPPPRPDLEILSPGRYRVRLPSLDYRTLLRTERTGEVAMIIQSAPGWVLVQTKEHYPPGLFRLPTGTVKPGEAPEAAMLRELHEEANLVPGQARPLFSLEYQVDGGRRDFVTDAYLITSPQGQLRCNDPKEAIEAWREAAQGDLDLMADELCRLEEPWRGWGLFRSVMHRVAARVLGDGEPES